MTVTDTAQNADFQSTLFMVRMLGHSRIAHKRTLVNLAYPRTPTISSHTRTAVRECCKGDDESLWDRGKFDPPTPKKPLNRWSPKFV